MFWYRQAISESKGDKLSSSAERRVRTQGLRHQVPADWMPAVKQTELSRIKLKTWTRQPVPMISEHSAHSTPLPVGFCTWFWRYTCLLVLMSMPWHRQATFESKEDKLSSSAECRIRTQGPRHQIASRLHDHWQTDRAIEDQAKNLNSTARPYDQRAFSPLDSTASWLSHLALAIYMFVVVKSNRKETSCLPLLNAGFEPRVSDPKSPANGMPADKPTRNLSASTPVELDALWAVSNRLFAKEPSVLESSWKLWLIILGIEKSKWITKIM